MPQRGDEDAALAVVHRPEHRLVGTGSHEWLRRPRIRSAGCVERVIIIGRAQHVVRARRLPAQICVELVIRLRKRELESLRDRMLLILDLHHEVVRCRMVAVVWSPVPARQLLVLRPAIERGHREVVDHHALARAHEVQKRRICFLSPSQFGTAAIEVVQHHQVVGREGFRAGAPEFFRHPNLELSSVFENLAQQRCCAAPVVAVLAGDDQNGNLRWRSAGLLGKCQTSDDANDRRDYSQSPFHRLTSIHEM